MGLAYLIVDLICVFLISSNIEGLFMLPFVFLLPRNVYSSPLLVLKNWLVFLFLSYNNSLYDLDTRSLLRMYFVNIFFHSVCYLCTFLIASFEAQTFQFLLSSITYFLIFLVAHAFVVMHKKLLPDLRSRRFTPVFPSKSFIVWALIFRSLIPFALIFVYGVR